jgi:surfactin synthase thioesterase subunit
MFMPAMRDDMTAYETYQCETEAPLGIPITIFAGKDDRAVTPESLHEWALHTDAGFDMKVLPGDHFFSTTSTSELIGAMQLQIVTDLNQKKTDIRRLKVQLYDDQSRKEDTSPARRIGTP